MKLLTDCNHLWSTGIKPKNHESNNVYIRKIWKVQIKSAKPGKTCSGKVFELNLDMKNWVISIKLPAAIRKFFAKKEALSQ